MAAIVVVVESTEFWAQIVQLVAVLALALVVEVRGMYGRVQAMDKARTRGARVALAFGYALAVPGLLFSFLTGMSGMTGAPLPKGQSTLVEYALIFTFMLLVVAPTTPLIWALIEDLPFSPDGIGRWKLGLLRTRVDLALQQAERVTRATRLQSMSEASKEVVEASRQEARGGAYETSPMRAALERFERAREASPDLAAARDELRSLLAVLSSGDDLTAGEARRWRAAANAVTEAGSPQARKCVAH